MANVLGLSVLAAIFVTLGAGLIWLGRGARAGEIDFAMGGNTRDNTDPQKWDRMQQIVGTGAVQSGFGYLVGAVTPIILAAFDLTEGGSIAPGILITVLATAWLLRSMAHGVAALN